MSVLWLMKPIVPVTSVGETSVTNEALRQVYQDLIEADACGCERCEDVLRITNCLPLVCPVCCKFRGSDWAERMDRQAEYALAAKKAG